MNLASALVWIHIVSGSLGLLTGCTNLLVTKGSILHKWVGRVFFYAMCICSLCALMVTFIRPNEFLRFIAILTAYFTLSGKMAFHIRSKSRYLIFNFAFSGSMLLLILWQVLYHKSGVVHYFFILITALILYLDYRNYLRNQARVILHLQKMCSAFICALTAFLVVNQSYVSIPIQPWIVWILPTLLVTPIIVYWSRNVASQRDKFMRS